MPDEPGAAPRPAGPRPTRCELPAAASIAVRDLLCGPPRRGRVLAAFPSAVYAAAGSDVLALVTADGVRLPNALAVAADAAAAPFRGVAAGGAVAIGSGRIGARGMDVTVGRWWDPRPRLGTVDPEVLAANADEAAGMLGPASGGRDLLSRADALDDACRTRDVRAVAAAARRLLGLGDGLTPAGDDLLAGTLAGWRLFGEALGAAPHRRMRALTERTSGTLGVREGLREASGEGGGEVTTTLSAALLRHAVAGQVAAPVARACRALAGREPLQPAVAALCRVGHSSGGWLLRGLLLAARC